MATLREQSGRHRDFHVRLMLGAALMLAPAGCESGGSGPTTTTTSGPHMLPSVAGADAVDMASMYVDRPARLTVASVAQTAPLGDGTDFAAMAWVSGQGTLQGTAIDGSLECPDGLVVAGSGRTLSVPTEHPTIQAAIDAAGPGDIVFVEAGVYHETVRMRSNVSLVGAGASQTVIDGGGQPVSLIDYSSAKNVVVRGFTLSGVGIDRTGCANVDDPFLCGGDWYAAAIYGDGHNRADAEAGLGDPCADTTILVTQNIIRDNFIGMMTYFHSRAVVRNNIFIGNQSAFVANHMQDHALLLNNAFIDNPRLAIGSQAAYLDVIGNIVVGSDVGVLHEFIQMGRVSCNGFAAVADVGERVPVGSNGNLVFDEALVDPAGGDFHPTPELVAALASCLGQPSDLTPWAAAEPGAFGGVLGQWQ
jgi:hypothetical protein